MSLVGSTCQLQTLPAHLLHLILSSLELTDQRNFAMSSAQLFCHRQLPRPPTGHAWHLLNGGLGVQANFPEDCRDLFAIKLFVYFRSTGEMVLVMPFNSAAVASEEALFQFKFLLPRRADSDVKHMALTKEQLWFTLAGGPADWHVFAELSIKECLTSSQISKLHEQFLRLLHGHSGFLQFCDARDKKLAFYSRSPQPFSSLLRTWSLR